MGNVGFMSVKDDVCVYHFVLLQQALYFVSSLLPLATRVIFFSLISQFFLFTVCKMHFSEYELSSSIPIAQLRG